MDDIKIKLFNHVKYLSEKIETRMVGTEGNKEACEYIKKTFESLGLKAELQEIPCSSWTHNNTSLKLGNKELNALANPFSKSCNVTSSTVVVGTLKELELAEIKNRIVIFYGELSKSELVLREVSYQSDDHAKIAELLKTKQPAAIIAIYPNIGRFEHIICENFEIPSVTVSPEIGLILLQNLGKEVQLKISAKTIPSKTWNISAKKTGKKKEKIVFLAHYDTKINTPGANDNAAGVAVVLTLAELLSTTSLKNSFEFIPVSAHEYFGPGSEEYIKINNNSISDILLAINFDGIGNMVGVNSITSAGCTRYFKEQLHKINEQFPGLQAVPYWYESDHTSFYFSDVAVIAFSSVSINDNHHNPNDTIKWISAEKLAEVVRFTMEILKTIDDKTIGMIHEPNIKSS